MVAKQKAEEIASEAHAAYNQRVLEGLKGFSGIHDNPNAPHWDEMVCLLGCSAQSPLSLIQSCIGRRR